MYVFAAQLVLLAQSRAGEQKPNQTTMKTLVDPQNATQNATNDAATGSKPVAAPVPPVVAAAREAIARLKASKLKGDLLQAAYAREMSALARFVPERIEFSAVKEERKRQMEAGKIARAIFESGLSLLEVWGEESGLKVETTEKLRAAVTANGSVVFTRTHIARYASNRKAVRL